MTVVLGYDESPGARRALEQAIDVAGRFGERLVVVYGVNPPGGLGEEFQSHQRALTEMARTMLQNAVDQASAAGVDAAVELVSDKPAEAIVDVADRLDARLIVVGTWGESPLRGAMLGSTAHKLLQWSTRPVLCVPAPADADTAATTATDTAAVPTGAADRPSGKKGKKRKKGKRPAGAV